MENSFLYKFKKIIRECNYDNTYKMAMAKSLVEISLGNDKQEGLVKIPLLDIAEKYLKYYWNQTIFFDLVQGSNLKKQPIILQYTKELIELYYKSIGTNKPIRFERAEKYIEDNLKIEYKECLEKIANGLSKDVAWRFTFIDNVYNDDVYTFNKLDKTIDINAINLLLLKANYEDLFDLIDYRWGLILETFNSSPKINKKVKIIDEQDIKRTDLSKFKKVLDLENPQRKCFICDEIIDDNDLSIDHVIPWSYLYSDDLWNLVYVHKSCNSSKSNRVPSKSDIKELKERNLRLQELVHKNNFTGKMIDELDVAIEKDYVEKFWIGCK